MRAEIYAHPGCVDLFHLPSLVGIGVAVPVAGLVPTCASLDASNAPFFGPGNNTKNLWKSITYGATRLEAVIAPQVSTQRHVPFGCP